MNDIQKVQDIPVRWYEITFHNDKEKFEVDEKTAEQIVKGDQVVVLRDNQGRLIRWINKSSIANIYWSKGITKEKYLSNKDKLIKQ